MGGIVLGTARGLQKLFDVQKFLIYICEKKHLIIALFRVVKTERKFLLRFMTM